MSAKELKKHNKKIKLTIPSNKKIKLSVINNSKNINKYIIIQKKGIILVKKGTPKGKYKIKLQYLKGTKEVKEIIIRIK